MTVRTWGDFEVFDDRLLGRGGMGAVYMGRQVSLDRPAAIKVLKKELTQDENFVKRFQREAVLLARLVDTHVVQIFGAGEAQGQHYYAMEYVQGEDLASRLKRGYRFTLDEVLRVAEAVGTALQAAWKLKIIHRDIKPSNIIVAKNGPVKVMDFGLAKNPESEITQSEVVMGTAKYMSPEQASGGPLDIRSDLYSLGVVLYELATGRPPFIGEGATAVLYQHVHRSPEPPRATNPAISEEVQAVILRLMAKKAQDRYPSPEALLQDVRNILEGVSVEERTSLFKTTAPTDPKAPSPRPKPRESGWVPVALGLVGAALVLGAGGYFLYEAVTREPGGELPAIVKDPPPAPPADPPKPAEFEEARRRGLEALRQEKWAAAAADLEEALKKGATDVAKDLARALVELGDREKDEEKALSLFAKSRTFAPEDDDLREKVRRTSFRLWEARGEKNEKDERWGPAAADWTRALEFAEEERRAPIEARRRFCETYARALQELADQDWDQAAALLRELSKNPGVHGAAIEKRLRDAEGEIAKAAEAKMAELRKECDALVEKARAAYERADWAGSMAFFRQAADPKFEGQAKAALAPYLLKLEEALAAPPGMVYVPAGKFLMGGGREVEGPEAREVELPAFYIDAREVSVREYDEFLKALEERGGHHPGCPKDEPPDKGHGPLQRGSQKPDEPVAGVDWWDAASYAAFRGKRLPRESEWEKAAGAELSGKKRVYPWGDAWRKEGGRSFYGCEGMGGGVLEWTQDWFRKYDWSSAANPDFGEKMKVLRGGVILEEDAERDARVSFRHRHPPAYRSPTAGIRCAQDVSPR